MAVLPFDVSDGAIAWLGVSKTVNRAANFYLITDINARPSAVDNTIELKFSSDDNINDILKIMRSNEVWGKSIELLLLIPSNSLFDYWQIARFRDVTIDTVTRNGNTYSWVINPTKIEMCKD